LKEELTTTEAAGKAFEDRYMRLYAEFENYKKRAAREAKEFRKFANEALVKEMLPVIDNLERAIHSSSSQENNQENYRDKILEGVTMTLNEILKVLERFNVKPVEALGQPFDPNYHEAVAQEESNVHEDNTVIREFQKGYLLHDRLIRPAMVVVSKGGPAPAAEENEASDYENERPNGEE
jgi:molecular chaperone GrpE